MTHSSSCQLSTLPIGAKNVLPYNQYHNVVCLCSTYLTRPKASIIFQSKKPYGVNIYNIFRNGYFPHRWSILLFTPPPGSRARRLGWSQYMHECVGASQGYHGVVGGLGLGLGLAVGWLVGSWRWGKYGYLPHRCGNSAVPVAAPGQDRLGCTIDPMIALRRANTLMYVL